MEPWAELLVGIVILAGLVGVVVQVLPGAFLVLAAVLVWAIATGGTTAWVVLVVAAVATAIAAVVKYVLAGRHLTKAGVPTSTLVWGGVAGVVGFFVIPVVGLVVGFVGGVYVAELLRVRALRGRVAAGMAGAPASTVPEPSAQAVAWSSTRAALVATGVSILVELAGALVATAAWVVGLVLT